MRTTRTFGLASLVVAGTLAAALPVLAAPATVPFLAHRAVYDFELDDTRSASSVEGMRSRIVYEFTGSSCKGYTTRFRQVTQMQSSSGPTNTSDLRSNTSEDGAGNTFHFASRNFLNERQDTSVAGNAKRLPGGQVKVEIERPKSRTEQLPGQPVFPTHQMRAIIEAAQAGRNVYESKLFDGSDKGDKTYDTLTVIGQKLPASRPREGAAANVPGLDGIDRWPVTISYFDPAKASSGEQTPTYSMSFDVYANGVSDNVRIDYGDFSLRGRTTSFEVLPQDPCTPASGQ